MQYRLYLLPAHLKRPLLIGLILLIAPWACGQDKSTDFEHARRLMVNKQIMARGVTDSAVVAAMRSVPRHLFVPREMQAYAYADGPQLIGHSQTISQPFIVAYMTAALEVKPGQRILEIGAGSGYQAAILATIGAQVYTIEIVPELGRSAASRLEQMGYDNITVRIGDGYQGWPEQAPYDRIIVTAAPEEIPPRLVEQLAPGGIMVLPKGPRWWTQELIILSKDSEGNVTTTAVMAVRFVPMVRD